MLIILFVFVSNAQQTGVQPTLGKTNAFSELMRLLGISETDLGYVPKGYWMRYPIPDNIPYVLPAFNDLLAEPHRIYDYVRNMALSVDDFLHPDYLKSSHNGLMKLGYYCGVIHIAPEFRAYNSSLWAETAEKEPLLAALKDVYYKTNSEWRYNRIAEAADFPLVEKDFRKAIEKVHPEIQKVLARAVLNMLDAWRWRETAMRNVNYKDASACWKLRTLGETQFDGMDFFPALDNCAKNIDMNSIYYAGLKMLEAGEWLADTLIALKAGKTDIDWGNQSLNISTPIGRIVLSGSKDNTHQYGDIILLVDLGGDDAYKGAAGATASLDNGVSLYIDLEGNDTYENDDEYLPSQGAGVFGAGVLIDKAGNDTYKAKKLTQGAALLGFGVIVDMEGNDKYEAQTNAQGSANFGVGIAIDNKGDDEYRIWGDGQGYGGMAAIGALINRTGNDKYYAEPKSEVVWRPDLHSKALKFNYSYAQGCGVGRRGDVTDGHSWAGGMGVLVDLTGDDLYESGNWSAGCGYWYGMGFLYDGSGNDKYHTSTWAQAAGAHFCIAALIDEDGDDEHICWDEQSNGIGFGHDFTVSLFLDRKGNDYYKMKDDGLGFAINKSDVFFFDLEGDDTYIRGPKARSYGWNNFDLHNPPNVEMLYHLYTNQVCMFADVAGKDKYFMQEYPDGKLYPDSVMKDGAELRFPSVRDTLASNKYYGIGKDFDGWNGAPIEYFRDKMKKRFKEFK